jgi:hypothetical protein
MVCWLNLSFFLAAKMPGDSDIEELPDIDDDLAEYGDLDAVLREGKQNTFSCRKYIYCFVTSLYTISTQYLLRALYYY